MIAVKSSETKIHFSTMNVLTMNKNKYLAAKKPMSEPNTQNIWGFDIETDPLNKNKFLLAVIKNNEESHVFKSVDEMLTFCITYRPFRSSVFVATNLSYDFFGSFFFNTDRIFLSERDGKFYGAKLKMLSGHTIEFRDTLNYHRISVEKLGKQLGKSKLIDPRSKLDKKGKPMYKNGDKLYLYGKPRNKKEWNDLIEYCETDAFISYWFYANIITKWCDERGIEVKRTMASIAMDDFRTNYLGTYSMKIHDHESNMFQFKAYYGGRTEVYERGLFKDIQVYDVNSLYPFVMSISWFPAINKRKRVKCADITDIYKFEGCAYIEGNMPECKYPPLPVRKGGKLCFPCGLIKGYYTFPDIRHAISCGFEITKIGEAIIYKERCKPFEQFVDDHYQARKERKKQGDDLEVMEKLVMNSLYGKFAFAYYREDSIISKADLKTDDYINYDMILPTQYDGYYRVVTEDNDDVPITVIPIWSAYVTTYARILNNQICRRNENVIYTDTDSFFVRKRHNDFTSSDIIGQVKLEKEFKTALIVRSKLYAGIYKDGESSVKAKGMKTLKTYKQFYGALKKGKVKESRFMKLRQMLNTKKTDKFGGIGLNELYKVEKSINLEDDKRIWNKPFDATSVQISKPRMFTEIDYIEE